ncbi:MAG: RNA polymerase sigma factor [Oscillospiraceae bacterium]|nr:RNA polymerase sigma factor [Oscillospiraceae bacterium]
MQIPKETWPPVERFVRFKMGSRDDAEDILQEVRLAAWQSTEGSVAPEKQKAWLLSLARHKIVDFYRSQSRRAEMTLAEEFIGEDGMSAPHFHTALEVEDVLERLPRHHEDVLRLAFLDDVPQKDIAAQIGVPPRTVKSRLHAAKQSFRKEYEGETAMSAKPKQLPDILPHYTITPTDKEPFPVLWEELLGWMIVPKFGNTLQYGLYDFPERRRTEAYSLSVTGKTVIHGVEGVEIEAYEINGGQHEGKPENRTFRRTFAAQLTDTHVRFLAESHVDNGVRKVFTFLDGDSFHGNWGFGPDGVGKETHLVPKGLITREGDALTVSGNEVIDVIGCDLVRIGGKTYDCLCVADAEFYGDSGTLAISYIDKTGHTVLWRRFNRNNWHAERYGGTPWTERLPQNDRITVNGEIYVHWYDCVTDYVV